MRRLVLIATIAAAAVLAAGAVAASRTGPRVTIAATSPFAVRGTAFVPSERVTVTATVGRDSATRVVTAGSRGTFLVRFPTLHAGACSGYFVRARGNRGSSALLRLMPECAPGPTQ